MLNNTVLFLMGPTTSGKSQAAIMLANRLNVSLISVDSVLIYKRMNIGTAKPSPKILAQYPHQLIDIIEPWQSYSASAFARDARVCIESAFSQNKIPLLVGGTSFYFRALEYGLSPLPSASARIRQDLMAQYQREGLGGLYDKLMRVDKISAERLNPNDKQRIMRALEVFYCTGLPLSSLYDNKRQALPYPIKKIVLMPARDKLHQRIAQRFETMLAEGLIDEVKTFYHDERINADLPAMRSVGYRQVWQYLAGQFDRDELVKRTVIATRQLCKRQKTWLRKETQALWLSDIDIDAIWDFIA